MHVVLGIAQVAQHRNAKLVDKLVQMIGSNGAGIDPHTDQANLGLAGMLVLQQHDQKRADLIQAQQFAKQAEAKSKGGTAAKPTTAAKPPKTTTAKATPKKGKR